MICFFSYMLSLFIFYGVLTLYNGSKIIENPATRDYSVALLLVFLCTVNFKLDFFSGGFQLKNVSRRPSLQLQKAILEVLAQQHIQFEIVDNGRVGQFRIVCFSEIITL